MPALPVITNTYRCAILVRTAGGQTAINVIHVRKAATTAPAIHAAVTAELDAPMYQLMSSLATVTSMAVTPLDGSSATYDAGLGAAFSGPQNPVFIPALSVIVKFSTASRGRSYRGRFFMPFIDPSAAPDGIVGGAGVVACQAGWADFLTDLSAAGIEFVVASYKHATAAAVTAVACESVAGTQRRRQGRLR